jgi:hypothetical protein
MPESTDSGSLSQAGPVWCTKALPPAFPHRICSREDTWIVHPEVHAPLAARRCGVGFCERNSEARCMHDCGTSVLHLLFLRAPLGILHTLR